MQSSFIWDKLNLPGQKISALWLLAFLFAAGSLSAQQKERSSGLTSIYGRGSNSTYGQNRLEDDRRLITYGFTLGVHTSTLQLKFDDAFTAGGNQYDEVGNIVAPNAFGFSIGFLANMRIYEYMDVRIMPKVGFFQYSLSHQYKDLTRDDQHFFSDFVTVDLPVLLKYKSARRKNFRMFYVAGLTPTIDVTGKRQREENADSGLQLKGDNLSLEVGFGSDIYFPLFRFSPEIRYSHGLMNMLGNGQNEVGQAFQRVATQSISLYLVFN